MKKIMVRETLSEISRLRTSGKRFCTLLGIGPMSKSVIRASLELGKEKDFPIMFIASRNQIDDDELGGGYVSGWNQRRLVEAIKEIAEEIDFDGLYYICRDHGGPWQRDNERADKLPEYDAMEIAKKSYLTDLLAGFDLLHIDPTKDPHCEGTLPMDVVLDRTVELIRYVEMQRKQRNLPSIDYEVGTEETNGGLTTVQAYSDFIDSLKDRLAKEKLPMPCFIVGQTGTLVRMVENVGIFDIETASLLSERAANFGVGLKEHNSDYLPYGSLLLHPTVGVTAANVAPEFGVVETAAYMLLADVERRASKRGGFCRTSNIAHAIKKAAVNSERWRKWMIGNVGNLPLAEVLENDELSESILRSSGHYTFDEPEVKHELRILFYNLKSIGLDPELIVCNQIKNSMSRYVDCFGLTGLTSLIRK